MLGKVSIQETSLAKLKITQQNQYENGSDLDYWPNNTCTISPDFFR